MKAAERNVPASLPRFPVARLVGHDGPVQAVRFTADGKYCLTGGHDRTVRLWRPTRLDPAFPPPPIAHPAVVEDDNGGGLVEDDDVQEIPVGSLPRALPMQAYHDGFTHPVSAVAVDDASTQLLAGSDKTLIVTDVVTRNVKRRLHGHLGRINAVGMSAGGETYLSGSYDASVRIWDGRSRSNEPIQILAEAKDSVTAVHAVQSDDLALIRSASVDGIVRTYDLRMGVLRCDDCACPVTSIAATTDNRCLAISCLDGTIRLMEADSGELLNTYHSHHMAGQYGIECSVTANDGAVVTGSEDGSAVFYDLVRATRVQALTGHTRPTCSIAVCPHRESNAVTITASYDGDAVVWAHDHDVIRWQD